MVTRMVGKAELVSTLPRIWADSCGAGRPGRRSSGAGAGGAAALNTESRWDFWGGKSKRPNVHHARTQFLCLDTVPSRGALHLRLNGKGIWPWVLGLCPTSGAMGYGGFLIGRRKPWSFGNSMDVQVSGTVASVRGSAVDMHFEACLPPIYRCYTRKMERLPSRYWSNSTRIMCGG